MNGGVAMAKQRHEDRRAHEREMERRVAEGSSTFYRENPSGRDHAGPVEDHLARLHGRSRNDLEADASRGAASPLGHGEKKGKRHER